MIQHQQHQQHQQQQQQQQSTFQQSTQQTMEENSIEAFAHSVQDEHLMMYQEIANAEAQQESPDAAAPAPALTAQKHKETFKEKWERKKRERAEKKAAKAAAKAEKQAQKEAAKAARRRGAAPEEPQEGAEDWQTISDAKIAEMQRALEAQGRVSGGRCDAILKQDWENEDEYTSNERRFVREYTAESSYTENNGERHVCYRQMNDALRHNTYRNGADTDGFVDMAVDHVISAITRHPLRQDMVFRRGISEEGLARFLGMNPGYNSRAVLRNAINTINDGSHMCMDRGFLSTSPYMDGGFHKEVEIIIQAHAGDEAIDVHENSHFSEEAEVLFQAGTKFRVIRLEEVDPDSEKDVEVKGTVRTKPKFKLYLETIPGIEPLRGDPD